MKQTIRLQIIFSFLVLAVGCQSFNRQKALTQAKSALDAASQGFVAWDAAKQQKIVDKATSLEGGKAALSSYRDDREKILLSFQVAYSAIATASLDPSGEMFLEAIKTAKATYDLVKKFTEDETLTAPPVDAASKPDGGTL